MSYLITKLPDNSVHVHESDQPIQFAVIAKPINLSEEMYGVPSWSVRHHTNDMVSAHSIAHQLTVEAQEHPFDWDIRIVPVITRETVSW